jgi:flagellin-like protein
MLKGISPLIATVLLIAFTMAIAGIMATWATTFVQTKITETENQSQAICAGANIRVSDAKLNANTSQGTVIVENLGTAPLTDFKGYVFYNDATQNHDANLSNSTIVLNKGDTFTFTWQNRSANPVKLKITATNCPTATMTVPITIS